MKNNFQGKVLKHLKEKGFNCIVQPKPAFPEIVAWKPFEDGKGHFMMLNVEATIEGKAFSKVLSPFFVALVECKDKKFLNKKEKAAATKILKEGRCNTFMVAYKDKQKLKFQEIELKNSMPIIKPVEKPLPSYFG